MTLIPGAVAVLGLLLQTAAAVRVEIPAAEIKSPLPAMAATAW